MLKSNCLIYVVDSLRYDHTSLGGYGRNTTPNLAALAEDAVIYDNFYTVATWTRPVASSMLSGVYPPVHKVRHRDSYFAYNGPRLPSLLQETDYETVAFSGIGQVSTFAGFARGFTQFYDVYRDPRILDKRTQVSDRDAKIFERGVGSRLALVRSEDLVELFNTWWKSRPQRTAPFFSLIWSLDPHPPFEPHPEFLKFGRADEKEYALDAFRGTKDLAAQVSLYDAEILYTDHWIGELVEILRQEGIYDSTMLIVVADHGEAWGEHGTIGHGQAPYDELLHVPLIIKYPYSQYGGTRVNGLADITDLMPSIISELLGQAKLDSLSPAIQGFPLGPAKQNQSWSRHLTFADSAPTPFQPSYLSIRNSEWKAILSNKGIVGARTMRANLRSLSRLLWSTNLSRELLKHPLYFLKKYGTPSLSSKREELYHLPTDPAEQVNRRNSEPEIYAQLYEKLNQWLHDCEILAAVVPETVRDFSEDNIMREHLKALGYID